LSATPAFPAVIPVKTGILDLGAMSGVATGAEIPAFAGMTASYKADTCGVRNFNFFILSLTLKT
jgi:hypothetical protein